MTNDHPTDILESGQMTIEVHLGPNSNPTVGTPENQILLTRCRPQPRAEWVATSFHKDIQKFNGRPVTQRFRSLRNGALPGLVAWLLQKSADSREQFPEKLSTQLAELLDEGDENRQRKWLSAFLGGDPKKFFCRKNNRWQPENALKNARIRIVCYETIPKQNLDSNVGQKWENIDDLKKTAASLVPRLLSIKVEFKSPKDELWTNFERRSKLSLGNEVRITVQSVDDDPKNIAVALLTTDGGTYGLWPWLPKVNKKRQLVNSELTETALKQRNRRVQVILPDEWNSLWKGKTWKSSALDLVVGDFSNETKDTLSAWCIVAITYDKDSKGVIKQLGKTLEAMNSILIDRSDGQEKAPQKYRLPVLQPRNNEEESRQSKLKKLPILIEKNLKDLPGITFQHALVVRINQSSAVA